MKLRSFIAALAFSLPAMVMAMDEIKQVELNDGTVYKDCAISEETDDYMILAVPQKGEKSTIKEEKKILKSDIKKLVRPSEEEVAYKKLERLFLDENSVNEQSVGDLDAAVVKFLKKFPDSPGKAKIQEEQAKNKEILTHLQAGEIKLDGKWITKAEQERIAYNLYSKKCLIMMKTMAANKNYRMALNFYEKLKKEFPASEAFVEGEKLAPKICILYEKQLQEQLKLAKDQSEQLQKEMAALGKSKDGRERLEKIRNTQSETRQQYSSKMSDERASGLRWTSINLQDPNAIQVAINAANNESAQFKRDSNKQPDPTFIPADILFVEFWKAADAGDYPKTKDLYDKLRACRLTEDYKAPIEKVKEELRIKTENEARAAKEKAAAERKAEADKRAAERRVAREKATKMREENARKAQEAKEKRMGKKTPAAADKPGEAKKDDAPAPAPSGKPAEAKSGLKDFQ